MIGSTLSQYFLSDSSEHPALFKLYKEGKIKIATISMLKGSGYFPVRIQRANEIEEKYGFIRAGVLTPEEMLSLTEAQYRALLLNHPTWMRQLREGKKPLSWVETVYLEQISMQHRGVLRRIIHAIAASALIRPVPETLTQELSSYILTSLREGQAASTVEERLRNNLNFLVFRVQDVLEKKLDFIISKELRFAMARSLSCGDTLREYGKLIEKIASDDSVCKSIRDLDAESVETLVRFAKKINKLVDGKIMPLSEILSCTSEQRLLLLCNRGVEGLLPLGFSLQSLLELNISNPEQFKTLTDGSLYFKRLLAWVDDLQVSHLLTLKPEDLQLLSSQCREERRYGFDEAAVREYLRKRGVPIRDAAERETPKTAALTFCVPRSPEARRADAVSTGEGRKMGGQ